MTSQLYFLFPVRKHSILLALSERFSPLDNSYSAEVNVKIVLGGKLALRLR